MGNVLTRNFHNTPRRYLLTILTSCALFASPLLATDGMQANPFVDIIRYRFDLSFSDSSSAITGQAAVTVRFLTDTIHSVALHLVGKRSRSDKTGMVVSHTTENGSPVVYSHTRDCLTLFPTTPVRIGEERVFTIVYEGIPSGGLTFGHDGHGARTVFADNWPTRAGHWIPVIDHPSEKAACEFIVNAPSRYAVVANGTRVEALDLPNGQRRTRWLTRLPLPAKVMAIGVADFVVEQLGFDEGTSTEAWLYPHDFAQGRETFQGAVGVLRFLNDRLQLFPYEHLAHVESSTRWGGMENATCIFYPENTIARGKRSDGLVAHETAHQWFGDAVSEKDWSDVWVSEGLATFCEWDYEEARLDSATMSSLLAHARERVLEYTHANPRSTIVDTAYDDPEETLNRNTYEKAGLVVRTLRSYVGDDAFRKGLRDYLARYLHRTAGTSDFRRSMEEAAGVGLDWFFRRWFYAPGYPVVNSTWSYDSNYHELVIHTTQNTLYGEPFDLPLVVQYFADGQPCGRCVLRVDEARNEFRIPCVPVPDAVTLNPGDATCALVTCVPE